MIYRWHCRSLGSIIRANFCGYLYQYETILEYTSLVGKAFVSLTLLQCILTVSILLLVPQSSILVIGYEILIVGILVSGDDKGY